MIEIADDDYILGLKPTEFEKYCLEILKAYAQEEKLKDFNIEHNVKEQAYDSEYQIDVLATFTAFDKVKFKMLVECKKNTHPVPRERVELLYSRLQSIGAQKGMLMATDYYQRGAIQFAKQHGIALVTIKEKFMLFSSYSNGNDSITSIENEVVKKYYPPVFAEIMTDNQYNGKQIYPTQDMCKAMFEKYSKERKDNA